MKEISTQMLGPDGEGVEAAAEMLRVGRLVAFPTETVYGLGGDARSDLAVAGIFEAKGRPAFNPLIVHVAGMDAAEGLVKFSDTARNLADAFWPGPLTLVLPLKPGAGISKLATAGLDTLAVRVPAHEVAQSLLARAGIPIAAPSANPSGRISPTTADHVRAGLGGKIDGIMDAGAAQVGLESTIIDCSCEPPRLLRPGGLPVEALLAAAPDMNVETGETQNAPKSPGQLASHYAPHAALRLKATSRREGEVFLGFGGSADADQNLSPSGDLVEAAANLFAHLHELDRPGVTIAVAVIPEHGLGRAINDRLRRAAAPRGEE